MPLHLEDKWVWDFWFAQDGADTHIFYLQADRSLKDEHLRHWHVSIGHAASADLRRWTILPDALRPSGGGAWDDSTTWTGSIIRYAGLWYLFYTGTSRAENGLVQRIGLATSNDLISWHKHSDNPLITADPTWYEQLDLNVWHDQAWRDPYVVQHPQTGEFHAFITARVKDGPADARGAIGHATSPDLIRWEVQPPLTAPGEFGHMEVPQVVSIEGRWYLLFACPYPMLAKARQARMDRRESGTYYLAADTMLGAYHPPDAVCLVGDEIGSLYSGKLIQDAAGAWQFMGFKDMVLGRGFVGDIDDPHPVRVLPDGRLEVDLSE